MGPRTDSLPRRGERPLWTVASHLCVSLPVLPAALSPTLGPVLRDQVPEPAVGRDGPVWSLPPGIVPASGSGACGVSAPRDLGRYPLLESLLPDASPSPSAPLGSSSPFPVLGSFLKDRNLKTSKNQSF